MKKQKSKRYYWYILAAASVAAVYFFWFSTGESMDIDYRTEAISRGDISVVVTATGALEAVTTVQVGSQVSGTISRLYADFNTIVKAGDVVAQIDPTFLQAQVTESEASLARLKALVTEAKRNVDVSKDLFDKGLVSDIEHQAKVTAYDVAVANLMQAEASLHRAKVNLAYATIRAPIDGVVISRNVDVGQTVAASFSAPVLFEIANDLSKMQVSASIDEADIGKIDIGQPVSFTVDAFPERSFRGRVSEVRLEPIETSNVITYNVIIDVPNEDLILMPGMTANVTILIQRKEAVLRIPSRALRFTPTDTSIIVKDTAHIPAATTRTDEFDTTGMGPQAKRNALQQMNATAARQEATPTKSTTQTGSNPFAGMSREQVREKIMSMSQEERQALREKFGAMGGPGRPGGPGGQRPGGRPDFGKPGDFKGFERNEMRSSTTEVEQKEARILTEKWSKKETANNTQAASGRVWVKSADGKLRAIHVQTGLTDGMYTELIGDGLKEGEAVVIMAVDNGETSTASQQRMPGPGPGRF